MNSTLQNLMRMATDLTRQGRLAEATATIKRALQGGSKVAPPSAAVVPAIIAGSAVGFGSPGSSSPLRERVDRNVIDVIAEAPDAPAAPAATQARPPEVGTVLPWPVSAPGRIDDDVDAGEGEFISGSHRQAMQNHAYKLYLPPGHINRNLPLVVMLHGCTQDPDDFAAGTGMNEAAEEQGFFVLYPAQSQGANPSRCWNWFKRSNQHRDNGEPALIADMTRAVMEKYDIDPRRVYIAGLSAGGAMATIVAQAYPEIFAAVGVHSGLPRGSATTVLDAFAVMKSGATKARLFETTEKNGDKHVPTIVFHGDNDQTVHPRNGEQVLAAAALNSARAEVEQGVTAKGRQYTRSTHHDDQGNAVAEHWLVHGAGHAWSGGSTAGTYTDSTGPDATREMLRFFFGQANSQPLAVSH